VLIIVLLYLGKYVSCRTTLLDTANCL